MTIREIINQTAQLGTFRTQIKVKGEIWMVQDLKLEEGGMIELHLTRHKSKSIYRNRVYWLSFIHDLETQINEIEVEEHLTAN